MHDVLAKSLGSDNAINVVHATVAALKLLQRPEGGRAARSADRRCGARGHAQGPPREQAAHNDRGA